ncbi:dioxygenase [Actinomycetospora straminea]|uniref:Hydroxyquinol 1,2-dioxygenase n=1 Tax=Actinomycetospora straminea TaxID=663607 RepID=A0ABP9E1I3_9PSEU|nr:dioxygenase [Actinomycetospora straminea]MDD7931219.1 dioxygenase [Actinomycetospora straminea]
MSATLTDEVLASFARTPDARLRAVLERVVVHLHELVREVEPTVAEWEAAIGFLTAIGAACDETRQEFILLSDVLGVSSLVEALNGAPVESGGTESTVLGPFHVTASPPRELGDSIDDLGGGRRALVTGRVVDPAGNAVPGAEIDVWQCTEDGFYDVQQPERQPAGNGRGLFRADADGRFRFRTVVPGHYPIPTDGPVGALLAATRRHPYRPAHVHLLVGAPGFATLTTHLFVRGSPYLDADAVFAVKEGLVVDFAEVDVDTAGDGAPWSPTVDDGLDRPYRHADVEVVLVPAGLASAP